MRLTKTIAEKFTKVFSTPLEIYSELDAGAAQVLAGSKLGVLNLTGLKAISDADAESLAKFKGYIRLDGLQKISDRAAAALSRQEGDLSLNGLKTLSAAALTELRKHGGFVSVSSLTTDLPKEFAEKLAASEWSFLHLNGLTQISDEVAKKLSGYKGEELTLDGLKELSDVAAGHFAKCRCESLSFKRINTMSIKHQSRIGSRKVQRLVVPRWNRLDAFGVGSCLSET